MALRGKLQDITRNYRGRLLAVHRKSCAELATRVVTRTPVDTGVLRASWTASTGGIDFSNRGGNFVAVAMGLQIGQSYGLGNGQPYARRIEYGYSPQAPGGMMRVSVAEWFQIVRAEAQAVLT